MDITPNDGNVTITVDSNELIIINAGLRAFNKARAVPNRDLMTVPGDDAEYALQMERELFKAYLGLIV